MNAGGDFPSPPMRVNAGTIGRISKAGVNVFVAGSAVFGSEDYGRTLSELKANW